MPLTAAKMIALAVLIAALPFSEAHHETTIDVDLDNYLDLFGTVEFVEWINPHVVIHFITVDQSGFSQTWLIQADSPNALLRKGINRATFEYINTVQIRVYLSLSSPCGNECFGYGYELSAANGRNYTLHQGVHDAVHQLTVQQN